MPEFTLRAENFRSIRRLDWSPEGTCLLAGANGAGKSTTLDVLRFLRALFERGHEAAVVAVGGDHLRSTDVAEDQPVTFELQVGRIRWVLRFPTTTLGLKGTYGEELYHEDQLVLRAAMFDDGWFLGSERHVHGHEPRCCAKILWDRGDAPWMSPLVGLIAGTYVYAAPALEKVKRSEAVTAHASVLHGAGSNLWSVLSNWKASAIHYEGRFDWVISKGRDAFPELLGAIEFERGLPFVFPPGASDPADGLPPARMADGLLTGLLHLTAVAGAHDGGLVAIDEMENQLHPHAIRRLLVAMRERAEEHDLTIILTSHSPVVMNAFRNEPENFYVIQGGEASQPVSLVELHDEDWLAQFSLGDLYDRLDFGAPKLAVGD
ncbi:AAA family ATPase [Paraliomyxa miuraensis]|uniref:AAA family ATPase n=1 Tax=Paraliomyxa miuraensis TaxID=376150 RepID=UPI002255D5D9|nr:AAA family ATPase [Paraliomyxa miuraensis]MCX4242925.1 ATP-binding protein [Paraliomyxa miuraensis]